MENKMEFVDYIRRTMKEGDILTKKMLINFDEFTQDLEEIQALVEKLEKKVEERKMKDIQIMIDKMLGMKVDSPEFEALFENFAEVHPGFYDYYDYLFETAEGRQFTFCEENDYKIETWEE
jgi:hypothetical protein